MATSENKLTKNDLKTVRSAVFDAAAKWLDLGVELSIPPDRLETIKRSNDKPEDCLRELLILWLSIDPEPTWKALCDALRIPAVGYQSLAADIERYYDRCTVVPVTCDGPGPESITSPKTQVTGSIPSHLSTDHESINQEEESSKTSNAFKTEEDNQTSPKSPAQNDAVDYADTSGGLLKSVAIEAELRSLSFEVPRGKLLDMSSNKQSKGEIESSFVVSNTRRMSPRHYSIETGYLGRESMFQEATPRPHAPSFVMSGRSLSLSDSTFPAHYKGTKYKFIHAIPEDLFCQKCKELACEPRQMECCSSLFCKACVPTDCPKCQITSKSFPDGRSRRYILSLKIMCPNDTMHGFMCPWKGELQDLSNHRQKCPREQVLCPYQVIGCKKKMCKNKVKKHEVEFGQDHLKLAMKQVVSLTNTTKKLQERLEKQESALEDLKEEMKMLTLHLK